VTCRCGATAGAAGAAGRLDRPAVVSVVTEALFSEVLSPETGDHLLDRQSCPSLPLALIAVPLPAGPEGKVRPGSTSRGIARERCLGGVRAGKAGSDASQSGSCVILPAVARISKLVSGPQRLFSPFSANSVLASGRSLDTARGCSGMLLIPTLSSRFLPHYSADTASTQMMLLAPANASEQPP
jgi:hypothetical protein